VVRPDGVGEWRWVYLDMDNTVLATSAGSYASQLECLFAAEAMKLCAAVPVMVQA
jgi:hypothetical protein